MEKKHLILKMTSQAMTMQKENCPRFETLRQELGSCSIWGIRVPSTFQKELFYLGKEVMEL